MGTAVQKKKNLSNAKVENPSWNFCQENPEAQKKKNLSGEHKRNVQCFQPINLYTLHQRLEHFLKKILFLYKTEWAPKLILKLIWVNGMWLLTS